jgi:hypothetical protein
MTKAGYSGTTLTKKLGIKEGFKIRLVNQPTYYFDLFTDLPKNINILSEKKTKKDLIHLFHQRNCSAAQRNRVFKK